MKKILLLLIASLIIMNCKTVGKTKVNKDDWDVEKYILEAQKLTNRGKYKKAIDTLEELSTRYRGEEILAVNYLIGFNLYNLKKLKDARAFFEKVKTLFEQGNFSEAEKVNNQKFIILSDKLIEKIKDEQTSFDPYHVREEMEEKGIVRPKKDRKLKVKTIN